MARRRSKQGDSLDLLLDTICNTFGGVLFIAILVVVLLQFAHHEQQLEATPTPSPDTLQAHHNRISELSGKLESLRKSKLNQDRLLERLAPESVQPLVRSRNELLNNQSELKSERERLIIRNVRRRKDISQMGKENAETPKHLARAQRELDSHRAEIEKQRASRSKELHMPVAHSHHGKQEIGLILRYGRMYVWHNYSNSGKRLGLNTDEFVVVREETEGIVTTPIPSAGIVLDESADTKRRIAKRLRRFNSQTKYMAVIVRPDSFEQFRYLRDAMIDLGFEYRLMAIADGKPVVDRGGTDSRVQ